MDGANRVKFNTFITEISSAFGTELQAAGFSRFILKLHASRAGRMQYEMSNKGENVMGTSAKLAK